MKKLCTLSLFLLVGLASLGQGQKARVADKESLQVDSTLADAAHRNRTSKAAIVSALANTPTRSALTYNALTQYFQSTVTTGANGGFNFKSSIFGLKYLFAGKQNDSLSGYYLTHKADRNTEISFGLNKASKASDQLSVITFGYKIAIINDRDKSIVNFARVDAGLGKGIDLSNHTINTANIIYSGMRVVALLQASSIPDNDKKKALEAADVINAANSKWTDDKFKSIFKGTSINTDGAIYLNLEQQLNTELRSIPTFAKSYTKGETMPDGGEQYKKVVDSVFNGNGTTYAKLHKNLQDEYSRYAKHIEMGSLLTFSINPGYNIQHHHADTSSLMVRYLKGFGNYEKPWNIDVQGVLVSLQDSAAAPKDFAHNKLKLILGANKIFAVDDKQNPLVESELAAEYDNVLSGRYAHERKELFTFNLITNIHLSKEFTLPLTLKYDVKKPNLFGFLSVQWNLQDSGKSASKN